MTKRLILIFTGLLLTAAVPTYAQNQGEVTKIAKSAKDFLSENTSEKGWEEFVDAKRLVTCGTRKCNLDRKVCMKKVDVEELNALKRISITAAENNLFGATFGVSGYGLAVAVRKEMDGSSISKIEYTRYECVEKSEEAGLKAKGYSAVEDGGKNSVEEKNKKGKTENKREQEVDDSLCYKANDTEGSEVEKYCLEMSGDDVIVVGVERGILNYKCEAIPVKLYYHQRCIFCFLMGGIYATADKMTVKSYAKLGRSFAILIALGLALWIAIKTLSFVSSMTKQDAAKYLTEMIKQCYKFAIAYFALYYYNDVFNYIIMPLLESGVTFGNAFVNMSDMVKPPRPELFGTDAVVDTQRTIKDLINLGDKMPADYLLNLNNQYFGFNLYVMVEHFAYNVNLILSVLQVVGSALVCRGFGYLLDFMVWGLSTPCIIYGLVFLIFGWLLSFAFVFYMLDALVQLGVVGALLPFLIASWPFKITSKWTSTGFKLLLNSIFTFMMMGLVARVIVELVDEAVRFNSASGDDGIGILVEALDTANKTKLKELVNVLSIGFCLFIFTNCMGFLLMGRVSELVNKFSAGGMKPAAPQAATIMASAAKGVATKVTAPIRKSIGERFDNAAKGMGKAIGGAIFRTGRKGPKSDGDSSGGGDSGKPVVQRDGGGQKGKRPQSGAV